MGVLSDALDPDTGESVFLADLEQFFFKNDVVIADVDVSTVDLTERSIITLDYAINQVSESRSELGAQINRFESTMRSLKIEEENLQSAVSQIQDTDVALEVSTLTQNQIIQQAATSVLAQANSQSNIVLALL